MKASKKLLSLILTGSMVLCVSTNVFSDAIMPKSLNYSVVEEEEFKGKKK